MKQLLPILLFCIFALCVNAQDININPAFGNKGFVTKTPEKRENILFELATSVIELPDGKLLLSVEANSRARLTRYLADGTLDKTYGTQGYSTSTRASQTHIVRTADGKILLAGIYFLASPTFVISCYKEDGTLDKSFGNGGSKTIETGALQHDLKSFTLQQDGKLLLGGRLSYKEKKQAFIMRLLSNGTLDSSFAEEGMLKVNAAGTTIVSSLAVNEKSIIAGAGNDNESEGDFVVLKYLLNGRPDSSFGDNGSTRINIGTSDFLETIALQNDGKIIASGEFGDIFYYRPNFALFRLLADGTPDSSFNQTGIVTTSFGSSNHMLRVLLEGANGKITTGGVIQGNGTTPVFARFNEDGSLDETFADAGKMLWNLGTVGTDINSGLLKKDGSFIGVGFFYPFTIPNNTLDYMLVRLDAAGRPDKAFGTDGIVTAYTSAKSSSFEQPKIVSDGKILSRYTASANPWLQGIMRYLPDGSADRSFADQGFLKTSSYLFDELPNKRLVTVEMIYDSATYLINVVMKRYTQAGQPDNTFGEKGEKILPLYSNSSANAIKILPDGKILISGSYINQVYQQQGFLVQLDRNGNLDKQFGEQGYVLFNIDRNEFVQQPVLQPDGKILVSGFFLAAPTYNSKFFVRRFTAEGMPDESFGKKGLIDGDYGSYSSLYRMLVQPDGKLLMLYITTTNNIQYESVIQRYDQKGLPDESFGDKGNLKIAADGAELLNSGKLLIVTSTILHAKQSGVLKLLNPNGSVDQSFGGKRYKGIQLWQG